MGPPRGGRARLHSSIAHPILAALAVLALSPAQAEPLAQAQADASALTAAARTWGQSRPSVLIEPPARPSEEPDFSCGVLGSRCAEDGAAAQAVTVAAEEKTIVPVNTGFQALGAAGATGSIDGPGGRGNGTYRIEKNDPYEVRIWIDTGYIKARMTFKRDRETGADTLRFEGRLYEDGKWKDHEDKVTPMVISYDASRDRGSFRWKEKGRWKQENYWDGRAGRSEMTIELGGGWDHQFKRD